MPEIELYDSITHSNMPAKDKSNILAVLSSMGTGNSQQTVMGDMLETSLQSLVGAILGAADAELKHGLDYNKKYPIDLATAGVTKLAGLVFKNKASLEVSKAALTVYSFRKLSSFLKSLKPVEAPAEEIPQAAE